MMTAADVISLHFSNVQIQMFTTMRSVHFCHNAQRNNLNNNVNNYKLNYND